MNPLHFRCPTCDGPLTAAELLRQLIIELPAYIQTVLVEQGDHYAGYSAPDPYGRQVAAAVQAWLMARHKELV